MPHFKPRPNENLSSLPIFLVADLILEDERAWNFQLLNDLFDPFSVQCILSISLTSSSLI